MDVNGNEFRYLQNRFGLEKSDAKLKTIVFIRPEIRRLIKDLDFKPQLNHFELPAWESYKL